MLAARSAEDLAEVAAAARQAGAPDALVAVTDVMDEEAVEAAAGAAVEDTGRLDVVVNVAGGQGFTAYVADTRTEGLGQGARPQPALGVRWLPAAMAHLPQGGSIVNVASIAGFTASPGLAAYGAAKAGVISLTAPWPSRRPPTGCGSTAWPPAGSGPSHPPHVVGPGDQPGLVAQIPLGRWADVEELARPLLLLPRRSYITGATLVVDGGLLA